MEIPTTRTSWTRLLSLLLSSSSSFNPDKTLVILTLSNGSIRILQTSDFSTVQSVETGRTNILSAHFVPCSPSHIVICYQYARGLF